MLFMLRSELQNPIARLPLQRRLQEGRVPSFECDDHVLRRKFVTGCMVYLTGQPAKMACAACQMGTGPFDMCIQWSAGTEFPLRPNGCANCTFLNARTMCEHNSKTRRKRASLKRKDNMTGQQHQH
ncbi:DUF3716 domain-containing protein [Microdochium nivale]|nr:DUF3716 domain-containing protein [Microdochium nivale]